MSTVKLIMPQKLSEKYKQAAAEFAQRVTSALGDQVDSIVLYGSVARGEARRDSDIDILLIGPETTVTSERISEIVEDVTYEHNYTFFISLMHLSHEVLQQLGLLGSPFVANVARDGIILYGRASYYMTSHYMTIKELSPDYRRRQLHLANEAADDAKYLLKGNRLKAAANRAYYAMVHAVFAALASPTPEPPKTHSGAINLFRRKYIHTGKVGRLFSRGLQDIYNLRRQSDYEIFAELGEGQVREAVEKAQAFVAEVERLLEKLEEEESDALFGLFGAIEEDGEA